MSGSEIKVLSTTAMKTVFDAIAPAFEQAAGQRISGSFGPSAQIEKRLADGEAADLAILTATAAAEMRRSGKVVPDSVTEIARSSLGVAVRKGAPKPDIASAEAFKRAMLSAKSIATSKPVGGGLSGAHMAKVFQRLGIAEAIAARLTFGGGGPGGLVGLILKRGEAEIGIQQIPELLAVAEIDFVGALPDELQCVTSFVAAIPSGARNPDASRQLIAFLRTPSVRQNIKQKGLDPA